MVDARRRLALACAAAWAGLACARLVPLLPPAFRPCRAAEVGAPAALGPDFRWRAQASLRRSGEEQAALDLVVEKRGDRVTLVAFDRAGLRALSAVQEGDTLRADPAASRRRPVAAETLLADLRRLRGPDSPERGIDVARDRTPEGAPRARITDARCGTESVYVTEEEGPLP